MKNKTKLVLGLAALTAVTAGAATTSTLAWFTTTRTASVQFTSIGIYGTTGDMGITLKNAGDYGFATADFPSKSDNAYTFATNVNALTDISGNGATFLRPIWDPSAEGTTATSIVAATNSANAKYYIQFTLDLTNSSTVNPMRVYLTTAASISSGTETNTKKAGNATRVAFFNTGVTSGAALTTSLTPSKVFYNGTDSSSDKYLVNGLAVTNHLPSIYGIEGTDDTGTYATGVFQSVEASDFGAGSSEPTTTTDASSYIVTIPKATDSSTPGTITVGVTIWLEGLSASCVNNSTEDPRKETVAVSLPLVGFPVIA